uniref:Leucine rich immune protein (Coil-less) n=1 Tax=Anopheles atroparvus TaxID=41427 RepID=A0AAG5DKU3_ANOAO
MYRRYRINAALVVALCLCSSIAVDALKCTEEELMFDQDDSSRYCVFRGVRWRPGTPEPVFEESTAVQVAFVDSNLTAIPENFYSRFPRLQILRVNNASLETLKIMNFVRKVYAEQNRITLVHIAGGQYLKELYLKDNPISSLGDIAKSKSVVVLDLSGSNIADMNQDTVDFKAFSQMDNLTELYLSNLEAHYFENENDVTLPNLKVLDLSGNPIIPVNFHLNIFRGMPKLEELSLRDSGMVDLSISNIRDSLPALKRINIAGTNFRCSFMKTLLAHLNEKDVEVIGATQVKCDLGYDQVEGLCCKSDGNFLPPPPTSSQKPMTGSETSVDSTTPIHTGTNTEVPKTDSGVPKTDSETSEEGSSLTVIIVSVVAVIVVLAVAAFVGIYLKRRSEGTHKPVPRNDPNENL